MKFLKKFTVLFGAMPELWVTFAIKFLIIAGYSLMNTTLVLWLASDFGLGDKAALGLVSVWALVLSLFNVLSGSLTDAIGFRNTFFAGTAICIVSRLVMALAGNIWIAVLGGLIPLAIGEALTGPVLVAAARTYSNTEQRSMSFAMIYSIMNAGFLAANLIFDWMRKHWGEHGSTLVLGHTFSTYQLILLASMIIEVAVLPLIFALREGARATDEGVVITPRKVAAKTGGMMDSLWQTIRTTARDTGRLLAQLVGSPGFLRLIAFLVMIAFLKVIYRQLDYVFPTYGIRVLGEGAPVGRLSGINNILIIFLTPVIGALTQRFAAYRMVVFGTLIAAASIFVMVMPPVWFTPMADNASARWLAHKYLGLQGVVDPLYAAIAVFVTVLSIGEAFYSPRVYEYAAAIAPPGQEASYSALSYVPILLAKLITGIGSGTLLDRYCPKEGPRHPETMWLIVAMVTAIGPIGLIVMSRFIRLKEAGRDE